jgi:hypothetical protein
VAAFERSVTGVPLLIILSLGAGMGVNTSVFTLVDAVWFSPWRVPQSPTLRVVEPAIPYVQFQQLEERGTRSFSRLSGFLSVLARLHDERLHSVQLVTADFFDALGVPVTGPIEKFRSSMSDDVVPAVVSPSLWDQEIGGVFAAEHRLTIHGLSRTSSSVTVVIVGVADPPFDGIDQVERTDVWLPLGRAAAVRSILLPSPNLPVTAFGPLSPGVAADAAARELSTILAAYQPNHVGPAGVQARVTGTSRYAQFGFSGEALRMWESLLVGVVFL